MAEWFPSQIIIVLGDNQGHQYHVDSSSHQKFYFDDFAWLRVSSHELDIAQGECLYICLLLFTPQSCEIWHE